MHSKRLAVFAVCVLAGSPARGAGDRLQEYLQKAIQDARTDGDRAVKAYQSVEAVADDAELVRFLLERCYDYSLRGARVPEAFACGEKAALALARKDAAWAGQLRAKLLKLYEAALASRSDDVRYRAGWRYAECLVAEGDEQAAAGEWLQARGTYARAEAAIRRQRLGWEAPVAAKAQHARHRQTAQATRKRLAEAIEAKPDDAAARERLIVFLATDLDDPGAAAKLLTDAQNQFLRTYLPVAAGAIDDRQATACRELGTWYAALATSPKTSLVGRAVCLLRAKDNLQRFLALYDRRDQTASQAAKALQTVTQRLGAVRPQTIGVAWLLGRRGRAGTGAVSAAMFAAGDQGAVLPEDAAQAVSKGLRYLLARQQPNGEWLYTRRAHQKNPDPKQSTIVATCALLQASVPAVHPAVARALRWLEGLKATSSTYIGLRANAWAMANEQLGGKCARNLRGDLRTLLNRAGRRPSTLHSALNAVWGVSRCARAGSPVPAKYWQLASAWWIKSQLRNGSWAKEWKNGAKAETEPEATVRGLAGLLICRSHLHTRRPELAAACSSATDWFGKYASSDVFRHRKSGWCGRTFENLAILAAGATAAKTRTLGSVDWYEKGKAFLLRGQREDGSWRDGGYCYHDSVLTTSYAILFLTQGRQAAGRIDLGALDRPADEDNSARKPPEKTPSE